MPRCIPLSVLDLLKVRIERDLFDSGRQLVDLCGEMKSAGGMIHGLFSIVAQDKCVLRDALYDPIGHWNIQR